ncbi:MAG: tyrosine-type recombinase/integrase [Candidatus Omnitrophota bacterium]
MGIFQRHGKWYISYFFKGRRIRKKVSTSKSLAKRALQKIEVEIAEGKFLDVQKPKNIRFKEFADIYAETYAKKKRSWETTDIHYLKKLVPFFGGNYLCAITPEIIEHYRTERLGQKTYKGTLVSVAHVNRELACLKCMFSLAVEWGHASENPVKKVKLGKENNARVRFLEKDELKKLLDCSGEPLRSVVLFAVNTGMRLGEIQGLKWEDVDFARGFITLRETKNGETRYVPMNRTVREMLLNEPIKKQGSYVFGNKAGLPYNPRVPFERALKKAGINNFRFHDLRHTAASYLAMAGVDLNTIRAILGHKSIRMVLRYAHLSDTHQANAVSILDKQMDAIVPPMCPQS